MEKNKKESHFEYSHRKSIELANQLADPVFQYPLWINHYWAVMAGYGFRPYYPGMSII